jgi:hypothetical protein
MQWSNMITEQNIRVLSPHLSGTQKLASSPAFVACPTLIDGYPAFNYQAIYQWAYCQAVARVQAARLAKICLADPNLN